MCAAKYRGRKRGPARTDSGELTSEELESLSNSLAQTPVVVPAPWNSVDPAILLSLLPDEMLDGEIADSELAEQTKAVLKSCGITKLRHLRQYSLRQLLRLPGISSENVATVISHINALTKACRATVPDLAAILHNLPDGLLVVPISHAHLDEREVQALKAYGICTYEQLRGYSTAELLTLPGVGKETITCLVRYIRQMPDVLFHEVVQSVEQGRGQTGNPVAEVSKGTESEISLLRHHRQCLAEHKNARRLTEHETATDVGELLARYWGAWSTLDEVALKLGITRPQAGYKLASFSAILANKCGSLLRDKLNALMHNRRTPLYLHSLASEDPWFGELDLLPEVSDPHLYIGRMIAGIVRGYHVAELAGQLILSRATPSAIEVLPHRCFARLAEYSSKINRDRLREILLDVCTAADAPELTDHICQAAAKHLGLSEDVSGVMSIGWSAAQQVVSLLEDSDRPLTLHEIAVLCAARFERRYALGTLRNVASRRAIQLGQHTWGLRKHILLSNRELVIIKHALEEILAHGPMFKRWLSLDLLMLLLPLYPVYASRCNVYVLDAILKRSRHARPVGKHKWQRILH